MHLLNLICPDVLVNKLFLTTKVNLIKTLSLIKINKKKLFHFSSYDSLYLTT